MDGTIFASFSDFIGRRRSQHASVKLFGLGGLHYHVHLFPNETSVLVISKYGYSWNLQIEEFGKEVQTHATELSASNEKAVLSVPIVNKKRNALIIWYTLSEIGTIINFASNINSIFKNAVSDRLKFYLLSTTFVHHELLHQL